MVVKFSFLTFDCYGTLIDWRNGLETSLGELLRSKGLNTGISAYPVYVRLEAEQEASYKSYRCVLCDTAMSVAKHFGVEMTVNEANSFAEMIPDWKPFSDTVEVLNSLHERGYRVIILSNIDRDLLQRTITRNKLTIDGYVTAEDVGSYKPSFGHWNRFFAEYKATNRETLHVAQSIYHDIVPSSKLGITNAWINRYGDPKPKEINPRYVFPNLAGLLNVLD